MAAQVGFATLAIVWSANLFNFMDGSDGLAAIDGHLRLRAYAIGASWPVLPAQVYVGARRRDRSRSLSSTCRRRATFMGDVGAVPLGFLAALFGIAGWRAGAWPGWFPLLVFLPFVADATTTLCRRALAGERVWEAHRTHYYQRLHRLGAGHVGTLATWCGLMLGTGATALACWR